MAAPVTTVRGAPLGGKMGDGYQTLIAFALDPTVSFWERTVTPPGIDGGDAVETTTMHNTEWRSMAARALKTLTESSLTVAYDPLVDTNILSLISNEGSVTVHFPDGSTLDFYGYLRSFQPGDLAEGTMPEATITITPTNYDPVNKVEAAPVYKTANGTVIS